MSKKVSVKYCTKFVLLKLSLTVETDRLPSTVVHARWICSGGSELMGFNVLLFLFPFQVECSSVNNIIIIIIMVKNTVSQRLAITYVNNSKDIFATQVR